MKTIEDIEKEYNDFEYIPKSINNLEELEVWTMVVFDDIDENLRVLGIDYRNNKTCKVIGTIRNLFLFVYEYEDVSFYDKDNKLVEEAYILNEMYKNYFKQIIHYSNEENYNEMFKFANFLVMYYKKDLDYIDGERNDLEYTQKGYGCVNNKDEDNSLVVHDFFIKKINEFKEVKGIEKVKKI